MSKLPADCPADLMELWIKHQAKSEARAKAVAEAADAREEATEDMKAFCVKLSMRQQQRSDEQHRNTQELIEFEASKAEERHVEIKELPLTSRGRIRRKPSPGLGPRQSRQPQSVTNTKTNTGTMGVGEVETEQTGPVAAVPAANVGDTDQKIEEGPEIADDINMYKSGAKSQESNVGGSG